MDTGKCKQSDDWRGGSAYSERGVVIQMEKTYRSRAGSLDASPYAITPTSSSQPGGDDSDGGDTDKSRAIGATSFKALADRTQLMVTENSKGHQLQHDCTTTTTTNATADHSAHNTSAPSYVTDAVVFCFGFVTGMILAAIYTYGLPVAFRSLCAAAASQRR